MVGSNTLRFDNPELSAGTKKADPTRIVIDPELAISPTMKFARKAGGLVVTGRIKGKERKERALTRAGLRLIALPSRGNRFRMRDILRELLKQGIYSLLVEGGGETNAALFKEGMVDELAVFIAPKIIGGREAISPVEGRGVEKIAQALRLKEWSVERVGVDFLIKGRM